MITISAHLAIEAGYPVMVMGVSLAICALFWLLLLSLLRMAK